jgi:hypothetical protein
MAALEGHAEAIAPPTFVETILPADETVSMIIRSGPETWPWY